MLGRLPDDLRALLTLVTAQAEATGVSLWLVGGVVRDMLLGLPLSRDVDLAVEGEVGPLAAALAAVTGGRVAASHPPFGTATVVAPGAAGAGAIVVDLARTRVERYARPAALPEVTPAPIEADLARRDFSINAMAVELLRADGALHSGQLLDPFGGRDDLAAGRLRLLHAASLRDDPTRMLRGIRLAARLAMTPTAESAAQIAVALAEGYLGLLSAERILAELCLALEEPRPDAALRAADGWGATPQLLPGLAWSRALAARCDRLAGPAVPLAGGPLVWAGLLLYDLDAAGLAALAARYPLPHDAAALLRQLTPLRALAPRLGEQMRNSELDRLLRPFSNAALAVLHYAEPAASAAIEHYLYGLRPARALLDGNDLRRLGVAPGPAIGHLLEALRVATLDGAVTTRAEAERWVSALLREDS